jgi:hypothetical protein
MKPGAVQELWRVEYVPNEAYVDQTGKSQSGHVVYERAIVVMTDQRFPIETGYNIRGEETAGRIALRPTGICDGLLTGDEFRYYPNMIDYHGGGSWRNETEPSDQGKDRGWWQRVPVRLDGYVFPDGTPARRVLDD